MHIYEVVMLNPEYDGDDKEYYFGVYNDHNGYYSHVVYENGKEIDYL